MKPTECGAAESEGEGAAVCLHLCVGVCAPPIVVVDLETSACVSRVCVSKPYVSVFSDLSFPLRVWVCLSVCVYVQLYGWLVWSHCTVCVSLRVCGPVNSSGSCNATVMPCVVLQGPDNQMANTSLPTHTAILSTHTWAHTGGTKPLKALFQAWATGRAWGPAGSPPLLRKSPDPDSLAASSRWAFHMPAEEHWEADCVWGVPLLWSPHALISACESLGDLYQVAKLSTWSILWQTKACC